jgi:gluconolactonase
VRSLTRWALTAAVLLPAGRDAAAADLGELITGPATKVVGDCKFTEGPAWHPDGYLLFSDIPNSRIVRVNADGTSSDWLNPSGGSNGLMCDTSGNVYACQGAERRVARLKANAAGQGEFVEIVAGKFDGQPFNQPNDLALDGQGGLYFTDPNYRPAGEAAAQPVQGVYYVAADGKITRVVDDLPRPNGILVTADGKTLYVANIEQSKIMKYAITGPGKIGAGEVLFTGDDELDGRGPDGMALDERGNIYATYKSLVVVSPQGELIGRLGLPEKPANCKFGGADGKTLYVTAQTSLYSVPAMVAGAPPVASGPVGSKAFEAGELKLSIPVRWVQGKPANRLRLAQFEIPAAEGDAEAGELVLSGPFGGSDEANIDRWIGQFEADGRTQTTSKGTGALGEYIVVELTGTYKKPIGPPIAAKSEPAPGYRMLGAILKLKDGNYFLKLTGPDKTVAEAATEFRSSFGGDITKETRELSEGAK